MAFLFLRTRRRLPLLVLEEVCCVLVEVCLVVVVVVWRVIVC
jgi:hypothetical protein